MLDFLFTSENLVFYPTAQSSDTPREEGGVCLLLPALCVCVFTVTEFMLGSVCEVINSVSLKDTQEQIGAQIQGSMKDNMTETLAAQPEGAQHDTQPEC